MPKLEIGSTQIDYELFYSQEVKRKKIRFRNGKCEVIVPSDSPDLAIQKFLNSNRRWIFENYIKSKEILDCSVNPWPEEFQNGGKIFWRGRFHKLTEVPVSAEVILPIIEE